MQQVWVQKVSPVLLLWILLLCISNLIYSLLFQVKLKCLEGSSSPGAVALYLLEPKTCEYILGVESPLICNILPEADDNGLVKIPEMEDVAEYVTVSSEDDEDTGHEVTGNFDNTIANGDD